MKKAPPIITPQSGSRKRKYIRYAFIIFCTVVVTAVVSFMVWRWQLRREISIRINAIRAAGLPVNWEDLSKWPCEVSDAENGALIYTNAIAHLHSDGVTDNYRFELPPRKEAISTELRASIFAAVETNKEALDIAVAASLYPKSHYPLNYMEGPALKLPHLTGLKQIVRLLECEAFLCADKGKGEDALKKIETSLKIARSLDGEPILISQLTAAGLLAISCQSLERVLCRAPVSSAALEALSAELVSTESTNRFLTGMIGERAISGEFIRLAQDDVRKMVEISNQGISDDEEKTGLPKANPGISWRCLGFFERDRNFFLRAMETNIAIVSLTPPASLSLTNESDKLEAQARHGFYLMSSLFLPSLSHTSLRDAYVRASLRTSFTAVAIERWRITHNGMTPDSLESLVPDFFVAVPLDPYDGRPLRFKKTTKGYVVYSIGPNRQDDGGKERPSRSTHIPAAERNQFDITFSVER